MAMCTQAGSAICLIAGVEAVVAQRFFITDSEAVFSAWGQALIKPFFFCSLDQADLLGMRINNLASVGCLGTSLTLSRPSGKNVPSMFGRPQRSACSSYAGASP